MRTNQLEQTHSKQGDTDYPPTIVPSLQAPPSKPFIPRTQAFDPYPQASNSSAQKSTYRDVSPLSHRESDILQFPLQKSSVMQQQQQQQQYQQLQQPYQLQSQQQQQSSNQPMATISTHRKRNLRIPCPAHPEFDISNMCTAEGCIEPLCPECIRIHTKLHNNERTVSNIDTIFNKRDECQAVLNQQIDFFEQERSVLARIWQTSREALHQKCIEQIIIAKEKVAAVVDSFFADIEDAINQRLLRIESSPSIESAKILDKQILSTINRIAELEGALQTEDFINAIIKILSGECDQNFDGVQQEISELLAQRDKDFFDLRIDESKIYTINNELSKLLTIQQQTQSATQQTTQYDQRSDSPPRRTQQSPPILANQSRVLPINNNQHNNNRSLPPTGVSLTVSSYLKPRALLFDSNVSVNSGQNINNTQSHGALNSQKLRSGSSHHRPQTLATSRETTAVPATNNNTSAMEVSQQRRNWANQQEEKKPSSSSLPRARNDSKGSNVSATQLTERDSRIPSHHQQQQQRHQQFIQDFSDQSQGVGAVGSPVLTPTSIKPIDIKVQDYFTTAKTTKKLLAYFQDNSKLFHYLDLETLTKSPESQNFLSMVLDIAFKIPMYHRSIITPDGEAFLTGGVDVNQKNYVLSSCYQLNYRSAALEVIPSMHFPRSNHGIVYCDGFIYVAGGATNQDNLCLDKCERFDVNSHRWEVIGSLNQKCSGCSLSAFSSRFIFKFGGSIDLFTTSNTIERYDIQTNEWRELPFNITTEHQPRWKQLPCFTGACQINQDEIILLGGMNGNQKLSTVLTIKMYRDECDVSISRCALPTAGSFWQCPLVFEGVLFSIQNVNMDKSPEHCYFGKKRVFAFNSMKWKQIGSENSDESGVITSSTITQSNSSSALQQLKSERFNNNKSFTNQRSSNSLRRAYQ